jgi:hypothetical protein
VIATPGPIATPGMIATPDPIATVATTTPATTR